MKLIRLPYCLVLYIIKGSEMQKKKKKKKTVGSRVESGAEKTSTEKYNHLPCVP